MAVELFVNGTLMRGLPLHHNLDGAEFLGQFRTAPVYRLYSIGDVHPGMPFYFRAASGAKITKQSDRSFVIDKLQVRITSEHDGLVREGDPGELLIPLTLPAGQSTLTLEYQW